MGSVAAQSAWRGISCAEAKSELQKGGVCPGNCVEMTEEPVEVGGGRQPLSPSRLSFELLSDHSGLLPQT